MGCLQALGQLAQRLHDQRKSQIFTYLCSFSWKPTQQLQGRSSSITICPTLAPWRFSTVRWNSKLGQGSCAKIARLDRASESHIESPRVPNIWTVAARSLCKIDHFSRLAFSCTELQLWGLLQWMVTSCFRDPLQIAGAFMYFYVRITMNHLF